MGVGPESTSLDIFDVAKDAFIILGYIFSPSSKGNTFPSTESATGVGHQHLVATIS